MTPDEIRDKGFGETLEHYRKLRGWSRPWLSKEAGGANNDGVSARTLKNWKSEFHLKPQVPIWVLKVAAALIDDESCASAFIELAGLPSITVLRKSFPEKCEQLEIINKKWPEDQPQSILRRQQPAGPIKNHPQPEGTPAESVDQQLLRTYLSYLVREKFNPVFLNPRLDPNKKRHSLEDIFVELTVTDQRIPTDEGYDKYKAELDNIAWGAQTIGQIGQQDNVFLLRGLPGSGKTTLLKDVGHAFASDSDLSRERFFGWEKEGARLIPIYIQLSSLNEWLKKEGYPKHDDVIVDYLEAYCLDHKSEYTKVYKAEHDRYAGAKKMSHLLVDFLLEGRCIVMFDGLDEVIERNERNKVTDVLLSFIKRFGLDANRNYILMASRPNGLEASAHRLTGVEVVICQVMPLSEEKRNQLIFALLNQLNSDDSAPSPLAKQKGEELIQKIDQDRDLAQIATNPLSCTALTLIYDQSGDLPKNRVGLLTQLINQQLELDETKSSSNQFSFIEGSPFRDDYEAYGPLRRRGIKVRKGLRRLAFLTFSRGGDGLQQTIAVRNIEATLKNDIGYRGDKASIYALDFLKVMAERKGLFILFHADPEKPNEDIYNFVHRQFMECLAAEHLIWSLDIEKSLDQLKTNAGEAAWDEVIKLYLSNPKLNRATRDKAVEALMAAQHPHTTALVAEGLVELGVTLNEPKDFISPELLTNKISQLNLKDELYQEMIDMERTPRDRFRSGRVLDALGWLPPDLHAWVRCEGIAEGEDEEDLWVMKYPLTNIQYEPFVLLNGYTEVSWPKGRVERNEPDFWQHSDLGRDRQGFPVVGVDWPEADAYCAWLTNQLKAYRPRATREALETNWRDCLMAPDREVPLSTNEIDRVIKTLKGLLNRFLEYVGEDEALVVRLPSDTEWVEIAGGKEGDRYPWDLEGVATPYDSEEGVAEILRRANVREDDHSVGVTSPVGMYPAGARVVAGGKIVDMAGNVWEWSSSSYVDEDGEKDDRFRYNRGGGWDDNPASACVMARFYVSHISNHDGFRCVCGSRSSISLSY